MRMFLAIDLPEGIRNHLLEARRRLEIALPKISYTRPENLHVTLKFLGEVEPKKLDALTESLSKISTVPMELAAHGIECFPNRGPIRIVTTALAGTLAPLRALVESIEQRCKFLGFEKEQRAHRPHVTLGRARPVLSPKFRGLATDATLGLWPGPEFSPTDFVLMESQLGPEGSKYRPVVQFPISSPTQKFS